MAGAADFFAVELDEPLLGEPVDPELPDPELPDPEVPDPEVPEVELPDPELPADEDEPESPDLADEVVDSLAGVLLESEEDEESDFSLLLTALTAPARESVR